MSKQNAFTLIELMVVISIIGLLMAILMPAFASSSRQAKAIACQSTLKQWVKVFMMYTMDNDGYFAKGFTKDRIPIMWTTPLKPYYIDPKLRLCPMATKFASDEIGDTTGNKFLAWGKFGHGYAQWGIEEGLYGSYGMNGHVSNDPPDSTDLYGRNLANNWRSCNVRGVSNIPIFLDCTYLGGIPDSTNEPPQYDGECIYWWSGPDIKAFCIDRHKGAINGLFMDWSVRKIWLKELWTLKWHREFKTGGPWTTVGGVQPEDWPLWMRNFKDF